MEEYASKEELRKLETKVNQLEKKIESSTEVLTKIDKKVDILVERLDNSKEVNELKNQTIESQIDTKIMPIEARVSQLEGQVAEQKDDSKWLKRTIVGAVIGIVIEAVVFTIAMMAK